MLNVLSGTTLGKGAAWGGGGWHCDTWINILFNEKVNDMVLVVFGAFLCLCTTVDLTSKCTTTYCPRAFQCFLVIFRLLRNNVVVRKKHKMHEKHQKHEVLTSDYSL